MLLYVRDVAKSRGSPTLLKDRGSVDSHECRIGILVFFAITHFGVGELLSFMDRRSNVFKLLEFEFDVAKAIRCRWELTDKV